MGTICSPNPSGTKTSSEVCNADWMASLPPHLHNVPLSNLAIPGFQAVENKDPRRTSVENQGPEGIRQDQDWPSQEQKSHETRMVS